MFCFSSVYELEASGQTTAFDILPAVNRRGFLRRSGVCLNRFGGFLIHREV